MTVHLVSAFGRFRRSVRSGIEHGQSGAMKCLMKYLLSLAALLTLTTFPAHADAIFTQGVSASGNGFDITDYRLADDFSLSTNETLASIGFFYQAQQQTDLGVVTYAIYANNMGGPGNLVQSETINLPTLSIDPASQQFFADFAVSPLALSAATTYWLELHAGVSLTDTSGFTVSWLAADDNMTAIARDNLTLGLPDSAVGIPGFNQYAFQLEAAPTPEPGSAALIALGLATLAAITKEKGK
jgi:hypothetical protein